ncbi:hydrophobe/amphiphile efflux-1 (HAE1) family protein [Desulfosalsimonas propionicica]|uniref:Hydrophobe/amphiphile efflux-1 (HAE1) family protein n=1 Tax=Desulfosalsimonas propionicica TaxID=332175 RepID=A0A7W0CAK2_9BACT|nr:efflux RND transporter permease subunit [Desulfosalsimonas propionicica]MBA2882187.1 hydrophobe/amphiphile efflux-1 (HAE1) family protein [Desulfosalsimonas propionicica]
MKITAYAVSRRLAAGAIAAALVVLGLYGLWRLPVDYLPDITYPLVKIQIQWPAAMPGEIDTEIADPVERLMATVDRLDYLESSSMEGIYSLDVHFEYGADIDVAFQDVLAALTRAEQHLPDDIEAPYVFKADPSQLPVMQLTVSSDQWDPVRLRDWADNWLQDRILAVRGVAGTEIIGGLEREIRIELDPAAMEKHRLSLNDIIDHVGAENLELTGGRITEGPREIIARTMGEYETLEDIGSVVLIRDEHRKVFLRDIARVTDSHEDQRVITRFNGGQCVKISVLQEAEANTVQTADNVARLLEELKPELPEGLRIGYVEDQAVYVRQALTGVRNAAIAAAVLLIIVVYLFLGSARQVLIMVIALPLTLVLNFGLMKLAGFSLNMFSLGGLIVAIGVVLDNSIVVVENISRLRRESLENSTTATAVAAVDEVGPALVAATLSFLALFVPFLIVPGLISLLFRELILVISGIVVISLAVAVTLTPMITTLLLGKTRPGDESGWFAKMFSGFTEIYGRVLTRALMRRKTVIGVFLIILAAAFFLTGRLGGEFLPLIDDGRIMVKVKMPTGASVHETNRVLGRIEKQVTDDPRVESTFALAGGQVKGLTTFEVANEGQVDIQLVARAQRNISTRDYVAFLRKSLAGIQPPGGQIMARQMPIKGIKGLRAADVIVQVRGRDMEILEDLAGRTVAAVRGTDQFENVSISMDRTKPEYQARVDRTKASELGISVADVARSLRSLITGAVPTRFRDGTEYYDIRVLVPETSLTSRQNVENLIVRANEDGTIRLRDIADVTAASGPVEIIRENQVKQITVEADMAGGDLAGGVAGLQKALEQIARPAGYGFDFGGNAEMMADMKNTVFAVLGFALFFSFIVLTVQFNSIRLPALILACVPVCLAGSVFAMHAAGLPLGATVIIGVLVVVAATVNDGVLLLTHAGDLQDRQGLAAGAAVTEAAKIRLRPRIMTSVTTMMGFVPLAANMGEGGDMLQPMAVAAIGGLGMEIIVALFLMPCLYTLAHR